MDSQLVYALGQTSSSVRCSGKMVARTHFGFCWYCLHPANSLPMYQPTAQRGMIDVGYVGALTCKLLAHFCSCDDMCGPDAVSGAVCSCSRARVSAIFPRCDMHEQLLDGQWALLRMPNSVLGAHL